MYFLEYTLFTDLHILHGMAQINLKMGSSEAKKASLTRIVLQINDSSLKCTDDPFPASPFPILCSLKYVYMKNSSNEKRCRSTVYHKHYSTLVLEWQ